MRSLRRFLGKEAGPNEVSRYAAMVYSSTSPGSHAMFGDREFLVREHQLGELALPSGRLAACDPWVGVDIAKPFKREIAPGRYRVEARIAAFADNADQRVACALVRVAAGEPSDWEVALQSGERRAPRKVDDVLGYGVDSGTGCFASPEALAELMRLPTDGLDDDPLLKALEANDVPTWSHASLEVGPDLNVVAFSSGFGDGVYGTFWGVDTQAEAVCAMTDFGLVQPDSARL